MRRISSKDTILTKLWILIGGPVVYIAIVVSEIRFSSSIDNFWSAGVIIWHILLIASLGILIEFAIKLKNMYISDNSILIKGIKKSEKLQIADIKKIRSHRLIIKINRPLVIVFKKRTTFGRKIYIHPTITDKNKKINLLEVIEIKEHLNNIIEINRLTGPNSK